MAVRSIHRPLGIPEPELLHHQPPRTSRAEGDSKPQAGKARPACRGLWPPALLGRVGTRGCQHGVCPCTSAWRQGKRAAPVELVLCWCETGLSRGFAQVLQQPAAGEPSYPGFVFPRKRASLKHVSEHLKQVRCHSRCWQGRAGLSRSGCSDGKYFVLRSNTFIEHAQSRMLTMC